VRDAEALFAQADDLKENLDRCGRRAAQLKWDYEVAHSIAMLAVHESNKEKREAAAILAVIPREHAVRLKEYAWTPGCTVADVGRELELADHEVRLVRAKVAIFETEGRLLMTMIAQSRESGR
jgi:hypothetical protein